MSVFEREVPDPRPDRLREWIQQIGTSGPKGQLILLNFFEEDRVVADHCQRFCEGIRRYFQHGHDLYTSYRQSIDDGLLGLLPLANGAAPPGSWVHFTSLWYLSEKEFVELALDERPPRAIDIRKPLGFGKRFLWVTFKSHVDQCARDATDIRNILGLSFGPGEYIYYFIVEPSESWIPTSFDTYGMPPFRPVHGTARHGMTRNLVDDSEGLPELLVRPMRTLQECRTGYLLEPEILDPPPTGYMSRRLAEFQRHPETLRWRLR